MNASNRPTPLPRLGAPIVQAIADGAHPSVEVTFPETDTSVQLSVHQASQLASDLLRACRAVEMDSFLLEWMLSSTHFNAGDAAFLLEEFHAWRLEHMDQRTGKGDT